MNPFPKFFLINFLFNSILLHFCVAEDSSEFLNAHNRARIDVGVGNLTWDEGVAAFSELYAKQNIKDCRLLRSNIGPYGENLAWSSGNISVAGAVQLWVDEKQFYNSSTSSCASGRVCNHYLQVVWKNTIKLGCFKQKCLNGGTFVICNYDPRANFNGQHPFQDDVNRVCAPKRLDIKNYIPIY